MSVQGAVVAGMTKSRTALRKAYITPKQEGLMLSQPSCSTYPIKSEMLVLDSENRPRLYQVEQMGSDRESFTVERYYDVKGTLRFVYVDRVITNIRIYLNGAGKVVWAVEQHENKFTVFDSGNEDWEVNPNTANKAKEEFQEQRSCPETEARIRVR
ncbi:MAG TPA: hypothetical protein VEM13_01955 [Gemmatimonadales bacterium]|nr:hypothetical protein [Gemmatimonadales bacterium]